LQEKFVVRIRPRRFAGKHKFNRASASQKKYLRFHEKGHDLWEITDATAERFREWRR
jgi:hypothetical protein